MVSGAYFRPVVTHLAATGWTFTPSIGSRVSYTAVNEALVGFQMIITGVQDGNGNRYALTVNASDQNCKPLPVRPFTWMLIPTVSKTLSLAIQQGAGSATMPSVGGNLVLNFIGLPSNQSQPTLSGSAVVGATLTASSGSWADSGEQLRLAYQWQRSRDGASWTNIGTTTRTYKVQSSDVGFRLRAAITAETSVGAVAIATPASQVVPQPAVSSQQAYIAEITKLLRVHTQQRYGFVVGLVILPFEPVGANDAPALLSQLNDALGANKYGCVSGVILKFVRTVFDNARTITDGEEALKIAVKLGLAELDGPASKIANQVVKHLNLYAPFAALQRLNAPIQVWNLVSGGAIGFCAV